MLRWFPETKTDLLRRAGWLPKARHRWRSGPNPRRGLNRTRQLLPGGQRRPIQPRQARYDADSAGSIASPRSHDHQLLNNPLVGQGAAYRRLIRPATRPALRRWGAVLGRRPGGATGWSARAKRPLASAGACPPQPRSSTAARPPQGRLRRRTRWRKRHPCPGRPAEQGGSYEGHAGERRQTGSWMSITTRRRDDSRARVLADHASRPMVGRGAEGLSSGSLCADWTRDSNLDQLHRPGGERRVLVRGQVHNVRGGNAVRFNPRHQHGAPLGARLSLSDDGLAADPLRRNPVPHNSVAAATRRRLE